MFYRRKSIKILLMICHIALVFSSACNSTYSIEPRPLTSEEKEELRKKQVELECAIHPERCTDEFDYNPWRDDPSCEPPAGQEEDWDPPSHCFGNGNLSQNKGGVLEQTGCPSGCTSHKSGCDIKGNISIETGEKIYHVPGGEFYAKTKISPEYGERWFCTEAEARENGWRKSKQ